MRQVKKERDFHRIHHKRLGQEKNKVVQELRVSERKAKEQQPEIERLREKVRGLERELAGVKLERTQLQRKVKVVEGENGEKKEEKRFEAPTKSFEAAVKTTKEKKEEKLKEKAKV